MLPNRVTSSLLTSSQIAGIAGLYFITGKLGLLLAVEPGYATAIWPPSGIALVAILLAWLPHVARYLAGFLSSERVDIL